MTNLVQHTKRQPANNFCWRMIILSILFFLISGEILGQTWASLNSGAGYINRDENGYVEVNGKFYLVGGSYMGTVAVQEYNPATDTWATKSAPSTELHHIQPVVFQNKIWVVCAWKGNYAQEQNVSHIWTYTPATDSWQQGDAIPVSRRRGSAGVVVYQNKIYIIGGNSGGHGSQGDVKTWVDVYTPATGTWATLADMPIGRDHFHAQLVGDKIYAIGGRNSGAAGNFFSTIRPYVDVYDIASNSWSRLPTSANLPTLRAGACLSLVDNEIIYMLGVGSTQQNVRNDVEAFNVITQQWRTLPKPLHPRSGTQAIRFGQNIFIASGRDDVFGGSILHEQDRLTIGGNFPSVSNPAGVTSLPGSSASFSVGASGAAPLAYQWQENINGIWSNITSAQTSTHTIATVYIADDSSRFRCVVSNNAGTIISSEAILRVKCQGIRLVNSGLLVLEAENYSASVSRNGATWLTLNPTAPSPASVQALPNNGVNNNTQFASNSPELQYEASFDETGTYYIWLRMLAANANDDSAHGGLDGQSQSSSDRITATTYNSWHWTNATMDGTAASVEINSTGLHTFNLWMREDGLNIDRIILSNNPLFVPTAVGPSESNVCQPAGAFPVELSSFTGQTRAGIHILDWTTASESRNAFFEIERSIDAAVWTQIARVAGAGNSNATKHYSFTDHHPLKGLSYYRLRQVDVDGEFMFSQVLSLLMGEAQQQLLILPMPNQANTFRINFSHLARDTRLEILDMNGKRVWGKSYAEHTLGLLEETVHLNGLNTGIYSVILQSKREGIARRLIVF